MKKQHRKCARTLLVFTCAAMLAGCLSGCGDKESTGSQQSSRPSDSSQKLEAKYLQNGGELPYTDLEGMTITVGAHWDPTPTVESTEGKLQLERIEYLESTYNCKFEFRAVIESEMVNQIETSVRAGEPVFDVGFLMTDYAFPAIANGLVEPVENLGYINLEEEKWSSFYTELGSIGGQHYMMFDGVPIPSLMLFWNKTMFEKKGLPNLYELQESGEWTFAKLQEIALQATEDTNGDNVPDIYGITGYNAIMREQVILSNGGQIIGMDENRNPTFELNSQNAIDAFQWLCDLKNKYNVMDEPDNVSWDYYAYQFKQGKVAMMANMVYMVDTFKDMSDDYGIVLFPKGPNGDYSSMIMHCNPNVFLANNADAQKVAFIWDLYTEPFEELGEDSWSVRMEQYVRDEESLESLRLASEEYSQMEYVAMYDDVNTIIFSMLNDVFAGNMTPAQGINSITDQVNAMLEDIANNPDSAG